MNSFDIKFPPNTVNICSYPLGAVILGGSATPINLSSEDRTKANNIYDHWAQSISFLEHTTDVSPFTSKFDASLVGNYTMTADEMAGYNLFNGKGNCNSCHVDGRSTLLTLGQTDTGNTVGGQVYIHLLWVCQWRPCRSTPESVCSMRARRISLGLRRIPTGWRYRDLGFGNFLRSGPAIRHRSERHELAKTLHRRPTANSRWSRRAMWP